MMTDERGGRPMAEMDVFSVVGPVMVGPSSSHTAGAVRIGRMARAVAGARVRRAEVVLHGSFADTYRGHGTDRAIVAGLLGLETDDPRVREALSIARRSGLDVSFRLADLGNVHPNTAKVILTADDGRTTEVTGSSIGGGAIRIVAIDGYEVSLSGEYHTLVTVHQDRPGVVARVSDVIARAGLNIAFMRVSRRGRRAEAMMTIELDDEIPSWVTSEVGSIQAIRRAFAVPRI